MQRSAPAGLGLLGGNAASPDTGTGTDGAGPAVDPPFEDTDGLPLRGGTTVGQRPDADSIRRSIDRASSTHTVSNPALSPSVGPPPPDQLGAGGAGGIARLSTDWGEPVVTVQPGRSDSADSLPPGSMAQLEHAHHMLELLSYTDKVDISSLIKWNYQDVVQGFLVPLELAVHGPTFVENRVNGQVLLGLSKHDLRDMVPLSNPKSMPIGDRNLMWTVLKHLRKRKEHWDTDRVLWTLSTPTGGCQYYRDCFHVIKYKCCPCCAELTHFRLTPSQLSVRYSVPKVNLSCGGIRTDIHNLRFLKEVYYATDVFCWCYRYHVLHVVFRHIEIGTSGQKGQIKYLAIAHPDVGQETVDQLNFLWGRARLVGGDSS